MKTSLGLPINDVKFRPFAEFNIGNYSRYANDVTKIKTNLAKTIQQSQLKENHKKNLNERLYDSRANCKIKTSQITRYLSTEWRNGLFIQLDSLMDEENWEEIDSPITDESFTSFLRFITYEKPDRRPGLGSTSSGNILAMWTLGSNRLTIEFLAKDRARCVFSHVVNDIRESGAYDNIEITEISKFIATLFEYKRLFSNDN